MDAAGFAFGDQHGAERTVHFAEDLAAARRADLYLSPDVRGFGLLDLKAFDELVEIGYRHAAERLAQLSASALFR